MKMEIFKKAALWWKQTALLSRFLICIVCLAGFAARAVVTNTPAELGANHDWVVQNFLTPTNPVPFSFTYNSVASSGSNLLSSLVRLQTVTNTLDANRKQYVLQWTNTTGGLAVKCIAVEYFDFPVVEWTVYLTNNFSTNTLVLTNVQALNTTFSRAGGPEFVLNGNEGDHNSVDSFKPFQRTLSPSSTVNFSPPASSGRSCDESAWPYYNLQVPGGGQIFAIGWPGQWASSFVRDSGDNLNVQAGQQLVSTVLTNHEQIRTPLIVKMYWQGNDVVRAQNLWRHWYMAHVIPLVTNQPPGPVGQVQGGTSNQVLLAISQNVAPDVLWQDAGWFPHQYGIFSGDASVLNTGTWEVDTNLFPNGFYATSRAIHALGTKFVLWFEPERIGNTNTVPGMASFLATNNPSWLLPATSDTAGIILNEGNPGAFNWLTNHFDALIKSNGVDWYREDMNGNGPLTAWRNNDATNRKGITENYYVQGHLAFWDALLNMNPGLRIDCCGAGGRRNDIEAMRRSVPLDRSDDKGIEDNQDETYGLSFWLPYTGQGNGDFESYNFRSCYAASYYAGASQQAYNECHTLAPIFINGDYYPLTPYTQALDQWIGWQFDRPGTGEGFVQAFRRTNSPVSTMTLYLQGLNPAQMYDVKDFDKGPLGWFTGAALMTNGLPITLNQAPQSSVIYYTNAYGVKFTGGVTSLTVAPSQVQLMTTALAANGSSPTYSWDFGDGVTSTLQNPLHAYAAPGRYIAQVTASDNLGNSVTSQVPVTVMGTNSRQMKITFSGYSRTETLTNFPALVVLGTNLVSNGFSYNQVASTNGWDLVFYNADRSQTLNYEIEKWDTNGNSYAWVQLPTLTNGTTVWAYWGDTNLAATPAPSLTNGSVWSNGFGGVWHLPDGHTLRAKDSTTNLNQGIMSNATAVNGVVDGAASFNGTSSYINVGTNASVNPTALTYSAWVFANRLTNDYTSVISKSENAGRLATLLIKSNGKLACYLGASGGLSYDGSGSQTLSTNQWFYVSMTYDEVSGLKGYVNGALDNSVGPMGRVYLGADPIWIGAHPSIGGRVLNGTIDEARISTVARGSNWVWAEWMNVASNSVLINYGNVTNDFLVAPTSLTASAVSASQVNLAWIGNAANASGYLIERSTDEINWLTIAGTAATSTSYIDSTGLSAATVYYYRVIATNATQISLGAVAIAQTASRFSAWQYSAQIAFSGYNKSETLTNFPALVNIGTNISGFAWSQFANTNGFELRFSDSNGNELPYERERGTNLIWTNGASLGPVWVRVPQLNSTTVITAYWGNPGQTASYPPYYTNGAVWTNGFGGVWHLPNGQTLSAGDSTANSNNGTITSAAATAGKIDGGASFNGLTAKIDVGTGASINSPALTYSAWVFVNGLVNAYSSVISKSESAGRTGTLLIKSNGKLACYVGAQSALQVNYDGSGSATLSTGRWYYLTMAYDLVNGLTGYVNGALDGTASAEGPITTGSDSVWLGAHPSSAARFLNGLIDEARISTVARDANWVWAEWMNMASNNVFNAYSPVVNSAFSAWNYSATLAFNGYTKPETLTNFPALVNVGTNISGFSWSQFASTNGYELRFADNSGKELPYERERGTNLIWTNGAGVGQVWVRVPVLNSNTFITAYWGNPLTTSSLSAYCTNGAVWTNGFGGVWHLPDGQTLRGGDSTANQNEGIISNATAATGEIDGAASFNGSTAYINVGNSATVNPSALTYSAWVQGSAFTNAYSSVISKAEGGRVGTLLIKGNGKLACYVATTGGIVNYDGTGGNTLNAGQWYYVTMAYDAATGLKGYVNGGVDGTAAATGAITTGPDTIWVGAHPSIPDRYLNGVIDEARISTVARDANWVWAEWMNMASNNVFITYGPLSGGGSTLGGQVIVQPSSFELWRETFFTPQQLADPSISGSSANPTGDGVCNMLKYAFGLSPWNTDSSVLPKVGQWTDPDTQLSYLTLTYRQNMQAKDLVFTPEVAAAVSAGTWITGLKEIGRTTYSDCDVVTVRDTLPIGSAQQRFLRILVSQP